MRSIDKPLINFYEALIQFIRKEAKEEIIKLASIRNIKANADLLIFIQFVSRDLDDKYIHYVDTLFFVACLNNPTCSI